MIFCPLSASSHDFAMGFPIGLKPSFELPQKASNQWRDYYLIINSWSFPKLALSWLCFGLSKRSQTKLWVSPKGLQPMERLSLIIDRETIFDYKPISFSKLADVRLSSSKQYIHTMPTRLELVFFFFFLFFL